MRKATTERQDDTVTVMDRVGALSGATYFVLANLAIGVGSDPRLPDVPTGQESLDGLHRLAANPLAQAATSVEFLAFVAWMVFIGYVAWRVRAAGWLAAAVLVAGSTEIAVKIGSAGPLIASYVLRDEISPELALVITQMNHGRLQDGPAAGGTVRARGRRGGTHHSCRSAASWRGRASASERPASRWPW